MLHYFALKFASEIFLCIWICGDLNGSLGIEWYSSRLAEMVLVLNGMVRKIILLLSMYIDCGGWRDGLGVWLRSLKLRLLVWIWVNEICMISTVTRDYNFWILIIQFVFFCMCGADTKGVYW